MIFTTGKKFTQKQVAGKAACFIGCLFINFETSSSCSGIYANSASASLEVRQTVFLGSFCKTSSYGASSLYVCQCNSVVANSLCFLNSRHSSNAQAYGLIQFITTCSRQSSIIHKWTRGMLLTTKEMGFSPFTLEELITSFIGTTMSRSTKTVWRLTTPTSWQHQTEQNVPAIPTSTRHCRIIPSNSGIEKRERVQPPELPQCDHHRGALFQLQCLRETEDQPQRVLARGTGEVRDWIHRLRLLCLLVPCIGAAECVHSRWCLHFWRWGNRVLRVFNDRCGAWSNLFSFGKSGIEFTFLMFQIAILK